MSEGQAKSCPHWSTANEGRCRKMHWQKLKKKKKSKLRIRGLDWQSSYPYPFLRRDPSQGNTSKLIPEEHLILMTPVSQGMWQSMKVVPSSNNNPFVFIWGYKRPRYLTVPCFAPWQLLFTLSTTASLRFFSHYNKANLPITYYIVK